jgi:hypothetical protein
MREKARKCDFSATRKKIAENAPNRWEVMSFWKFLLFSSLDVLLKKRLLDGECKQ